MRRATDAAGGSLAQQVMQVRQQSDHADKDQVDGDNEVQQTWDDKDQQTGDQCDKWLQGDHIDGH